MLENVGFYLLVAAVLLAMAGYIWLLVNAFDTSTVWGLVVLLVPPVAPIYLIIHRKKQAGPLVLFLLALLLGASPFALSMYERYVFSFGPREKMVDGEMHLTLTGWDRDDYSMLTVRPDVVVLQMANADVTDATLKNLEGMKKLRELDLNDSAVTDEGLAILAELPALETLRLRKTAITDEGFRRSLMGLERLKELDLTGTKVASKTVREWRAAQPGRRALK